SIADGIDSINKEVEENTKHVDDTSTDIQNFKNEINQAEAGRVQDENERKSNESNRANEFNSIKNQFDTLKDNSNAATNNANSAANTANSAASRVDGAINDLKGKSIGTVNLFDNTDFSIPIISLYESTASCQFIQDTSIQGQSSIFYPGKNIIGIQSYNNIFGDTYCTFMQTNDRIIQSNTTYTLSFWYISLHTGDDLQSSSFIYINRNSSGAELVELNDLDLNSHGANWTKYTKTFTTHDDVKNIQLRLGFRCSAYSWMVIDGLKLEKGRVATDWNLSNTDIQNIPTGIGVTNLLSNSGQLVDTGNWWLNKAGNTNASIGLDIGYNGTTHGLKAVCDNAGDWCILQSGALKNNDFYFTENEYYTLSGLMWVNDPVKYHSIPISIADGSGQNQIFGSNIIFNSENVEYGDPHYSKFSFTFKAPSKGNENQLKITLNTGIQIYLAYIKLERGKVATDWNYSIYDIKQMKTNINSVSSNLQELKEKQEKDIEWTNGNVTSNAKDITALKDSCYKLSQEADANTSQIKSHNDTLYDLQHNWFSDCSNSLCINGFTSLKVYPQGVYYITGTAVTILESIDHSAMKNGQCIYFIAETCDQTANIKFPASLSSSSVYTPKGQDFWITGRDNGDTIYIMQKIGGALRFRSL
ncbi:MAG: hypothetical protein ACRDBY_06005, partial [Cetobacterium sp.]